MKKYFLYSFFIVFLHLPLLHAEIEQGDHYLKFSGGSTGGLGRFKDLTSPGIIFGGSYRYQLWDPLSFGAEASFSDFRDRNLDNNTKYEVDVVSIGVFLRYDFKPHNVFLPYISAGPIHNKVKVKYFTTTQTFSSDSNKTGAFAGLGFDFDYEENFSWGAEVRYKYIGSDTEAFNALLNIGFRLG